MSREVKVYTDFRSIPVVVAKCGLYLKEYATEVEGTFRISGSAKRMRELQTIFDSGPKVKTIEGGSADCSTDAMLTGRPCLTHLMM